MQNSGHYIILTAVSDNFWDEYIIFYESLRRITDLTLVVVVLELNDDQQELLSNQINVIRIDFKPEEFQVFKRLGGHWRQWFKPFFIKKCVNSFEAYDEKPETILWIDCDTVILQSLEPLFQEAEEKFLIVRDYFAPDTTINDGRLYEKYDCPVDEQWKEESALNSGVIGIKPNRDQHIIDLWVEKINILLDDPEAREWVRLYDQGALLWVMRELDILHLIKMTTKEPGVEAWNYPAKRNVYELTSGKVWEGQDDRIGSDLIESIRLDNPKAVIAHFAGLPKLSQLCQVNHPQSISFLQHKAHPPKLQLFCVGLERCGTHSFAEMIRRTAVVESWVRHEHSPSLSEEAFKKFQSKEFDRTNLEEKLKLYNRDDCKLICEANHRLGFFIDEIYEATEGHAKFVVLLRNPLNLIESRLMNYTLWPKILTKFPGFYQFEAFKLRQRFPTGSDEQNQWRIRYPEYLDSDIIDLHLWEIINTLDFIFEQLDKLPRESYEILWLEEIQEWWRIFSRMVGPPYLKIQNMHGYSKVKYGKRLRSGDASQKWASNLVIQNRAKIMTLFYSTLRKHHIEYRDVEFF